MSDVADEFWKYSFAVVTLNEALTSLEELRKLGAKDSQGAVGRALWVHFAISYGRPFKLAKRVGRVPEEIAKDSGNKEAHDRIIRLRDQVFAHSDQGAKYDEGPDLNLLVYQVRADGRAMPSTGTRLPAYKHVDVYIEHIENVILRIGEEVATLAEDLGEPEAELAEGEYLFDPKQPPGQRWKPYQPS